MRGMRRWIGRALKRVRANLSVVQSAPVARATPADIAAIVDSGHFRVMWYLDRYPDIAESGIDPAAHYIEYGWREGRDPGPDFSTTAYLEAYPDVAAAGINPLVHYHLAGRIEGRRIADATMTSEDAVHDGLDLPPPGPAAEDLALAAASDLFDRDWVRAAYPDLAAAGVDLLVHFVAHGGSERRDPGPRFNTRDYLDRYPDVLAAGMNPLVHYLKAGAAEGRVIIASDHALAVRDDRAVVRDSGLFDRDWFLATYPDIAAAGVDPLAHFAAHGGSERRDPGPRFNTRVYLDTYPDVAASGLNPLVHYCVAGQAEGRLVVPSDLAGYGIETVLAPPPAATPVPAPAPDAVPASAPIGAEGVALPESPPAEPVLAADTTLSSASADDPTVRDDLALIRASALFDRAWFLATYPDIAAAGVDPVEHFLAHGGSERRDPGPHFNTRLYLDTYPDVAAAGINPLVHYLKAGASEGRTIVASDHRSSLRDDRTLVLDSGLFDREWFLATYPDLAAAGVDPIEHFLAHGGSERRDPGPRFNTRVYLDASPDVVASGLNPLVHYCVSGWSEGRLVVPSDHAVNTSGGVADRDSTPALSGQPSAVEPEAVAATQTSAAADETAVQADLALIRASALFDQAWFLTTYPDIAAAGVDPVDHFRAHGGSERRDPGPQFNTRLYLDTYRDVAQAGINPLVHYLKAGAAEGRTIAASDHAPAIAMVHAPAPPASAAPPVAPADPALQRDLLTVVSSPLFDVAWYRLQYPDIAAAGIDPVWHYLEFGAFEFRDPGPDFSSRHYLDANPDVAAARINPLVHFERSGRTEGRSIAPSPRRRAVLPFGEHQWERANTGFRVRPPVTQTAYPRKPLPPRAPTAQVLHARTLSLSGSDLGHGKAHAAGSTDPDPLAEAVPLIAAFRRLSGLKSAADILITTEQGVPWRDVQVDFTRDLPPTRAVWWEQAGERFSVEDLWFTHETGLSIRVRHEDPARAQAAPLTLTAYQYGGADIEALSVVGSAELASDQSTVNLELVNPFYPVLVVLTGAGRLLQATSLIAVPSLCRGGAHAREVTAKTTEATPYAVALFDYADRLIREFLPRAPGREHAILLECNANNAPGGEILLSQAFRLWLSRVHRVHIRLQHPTGLDPDQAGALEQRVQEFNGRPPADDRFQMTLALPLQAIPAAEVLFEGRSRRRKGWRDGPVAILVADPGSDWAVDCITLPAGQDPAIQSFGLQMHPDDADAGPAAPPAGKQASTPITLAIIPKLAPPRDRNALAITFDPRVEIAQVLKARRLTPRPNLPLTVLIETKGDPAELAVLLDALAHQDDVILQDTLIVIEGPLASDRVDAIRRLSDGFDRLGTVDIILPEPHQTRADRLNAAWPRATGAQILFLPGDAVLFDHRALAALVAIKAASGATALNCGVVSLLADPPAIDLSVARFGCHIETIGATAALSTYRLAEDARLALLPWLAWPVAVNRSDGLLLDQLHLTRIGGFPRRFDNSVTGDFALAQRLAKFNIPRLCTSFVCIGRALEPAAIAARTVETTAFVIDLESPVVRRAAFVRSVG